MLKGDHYDQFLKLANDETQLYITTFFENQALDIEKTEPGVKLDEETLINMRLQKFKLAKYVAYCVDGGLLGSKFNLAFIIEHMKE